MESRYKNRIRVDLVEVKKGKEILGKSKIPGLVNGQPATIKDVVYLEGQVPNKDLPSFIVVECPNYKKLSFQKRKRRSGSRWRHVYSKMTLSPLTRKSSFHALKPKASA